jgi:ferrous iron transport protein B
MSPAASLRDAGREKRADPRAGLTVALVGNPNSGKTTIFNALTGLRQKVGNYPGITVEKRTGRVPLGDGAIAEVIDLPGTYSLVTLSPDEQVVSDVLIGARSDTARPDVVIAVVDASNLARNLYLVSQLLDLRLPLVIALNMVDMATEQGSPVDADVLADALGCAVVPLVGRRREGIPALIAKIAEARRPHRIDFPVPKEMEEEVGTLAESIAASEGDEMDADLARVEARRLLSGETGHDTARLRARAPIGMVLSAARGRLTASKIDPAQEDIEARYRWIDGVVAKAVSHDAGNRRRTISERVDAVLMHRVLGLLIFAVIMTALFTCVFWLAKPLMDGVKIGVAWMATKTASSMGEGPLKALIVDGVFAGVGAVLVFVPQIALLFLSLALLEDSGYLARAAFLMDRLLSRVGLHGKSFIPLLSSFACAIPGILAARTIEGRRDRLATILVAPFMTCSARLPVYALLIGACVPGMGAFRQALFLLGLYLLGIVAAVLTSLLIRRRLERSKPSAFILELPTYKRPQPTQIAWQVWTNTRAFVTRAGTTIFALSIVLWALLYYPRLPATEALRAQTAQAQQAAQIEHSFAGRAGHAIEPAVRPLGFDWKIGVGLVGAFAAREVFVSTLGIAYSLGEVREDTTDLSRAMAKDRYRDGRTVWTPLVAISLMLWFVLAMQCMSTMAVVRRETGGWKWPITQLFFMNGLAYAVCFVVYQVGRRFLGG